MSLHHISEGGLPHLGILDPRTQRLLWQHNGGIDKDDLAIKCKSRVRSPGSSLECGQSRYLVSCSVGRRDEVQLGGR
jgi:hypothetical protein